MITDAEEDSAPEVVEVETVLDPEVVVVVREVVVEAVVVVVVVEREEAEVVVDEREEMEVAEVEVRVPLREKVIAQEGEVSQETAK